MSNTNFTPEMAMIFFNIFIAEKTIAQVFDKAYESSGVSTKQWLVLTMATNIQKPTIQNIAKKLHTSHQNVKVIATNLSQQGLVVIEKDPTDQRASIIKTTPEFKKLNKKRGNLDEQNLSELFSVLNDQELSNLNNYLNKIINNTKNIQDKIK